MVFLPKAPDIQGTGKTNSTKMRKGRNAGFFHEVNFKTK